jgi:hypothetical protein
MSDGANTYFGITNPLMGSIRFISEKVPRMTQQGIGENEEQKC